MAFDWHDYVEVEDGPDAEAIRKSLDEMAQTPEGRETIEKAAANVRTATGLSEAKVRFMPIDSGSTVSYHNGIIEVSPDDSICRYKGKDGQFHDLSMQQMVFHEMTHIAHPRILSEAEPPTIEATNAYMKKYYGEPERDPEAHGNMDASKIDIEGTEGWDWNPNFDPSGNIREVKPLAVYEGSGLSVIEQFRSIDKEASAQLSPEMQSLWVNRENPDRFEEQLRTILRETDKDTLQLGLKDFSETFQKQRNEKQNQEANPTLFKDDNKPANGPIINPQP